MVMMEETKNFLRFIIAILHSSDSISWISIAFTGRILLGPEAPSLASKSFASFLDYSVNYYINMCNIPQFRALYNNDTV